MGFICIMILLIVKLIYSMQTSLEDTKCKTTRVMPDGLTYLDSNGKMRLLSNNHWAEYTSASIKYYGDYVLLDLDNHSSLVKNISQEKLQEKYLQLKKDAIKNHCSTYSLDKARYELMNSSNANILHSKLQGTLFKDIYNDKIYVIRKFGHNYYYMNVQTLLIERETDYSKTYPDNANVINIDEFNKKQIKEQYSYNLYPYCGWYDNYS